MKRFTSYLRNDTFLSQAWIFSNLSGHESFICSVWAPLPRFPLQWVYKAMESQHPIQSLIFQNESNFLCCSDTASPITDLHPNLQHFFSQKRKKTSLHVTSPAKASDSVSTYLSMAFFQLLLLLTFPTRNQLIEHLSCMIPSLCIFLMNTLF